MVKKKIFLINGLARSGKDYNAEVLKEAAQEKGSSCSILHFAYAIKDIISISTELSIQEINDLKNDEEPILARFNGHQKIFSNFRSLLQRFGTEAMKKYFGDDVWANIVLREIQKRDSDIFIIPDWRFLSEIKTLHELENKGYDIITIKIIDRNIKRINNHASETELDEYVPDFVIDNTGHPCNKGVLREILES
jgi:hypothetical protein